MRTLQVTFLALAIAAGATAEGPPVAKEVLAAKKVLLVDRGGDTKVFDQVYSKLASWGRWEIVEDPRQADMVLVVASRLQDFGAIATVNPVGNGAIIAGTPIYSDKRYLSLVSKSTGHTLLTVSCEARISSGSTAGILVGNVRKRIASTEKGK